MMPLETERLRVRKFTLDDAPFILELLNEPSFIEQIRDTQTRTVDDAKTYLKSGPLSAYDVLGFGLFGVELKADSTLIGMCGLVKRLEFSVPDLGFAFLSRVARRGYALEASRAVLEHFKASHPSILAITKPTNHPSKGLLLKLGFTPEGSTVVAEKSVDLYRITL